MRAIGIHEDWTATPKGRTPAEVKARYPLATIGCVFTGKPLTLVQDLRAKVFNALKPYLAAGVKVLYLRVKTDITQTRSGAWDARYLELAVYIAKLQLEYGVEIILIPWHEPEDNFPNGKTFVEYYNRVFDAVKAGSTAVKVKPCFMTYHWAPGKTGSIEGKTDNPSDWLNGLKMTDGVTVDVYSGRSFGLQLILPEHPGFARFIFHLPSSIRWSTTERGWETPSKADKNYRPSVRVTSMHREFVWVLSDDPIAQRCDDYTVWSSPGTENAPGLVIDPMGEREIDSFLEQAHAKVAPVLLPNTNDPQYQFGHAAGVELGRIQGRNIALAEIQDWAKAHLAKEV